MIRGIDVEFALVIAARHARNFFSRMQMQQTYEKLARHKKEQKALFEKYVDGFPYLYKEVNKGTIARFVTPLWKDFNEKAEKAFLPYPSFSFLHDPVIMLTMFGGKTLSDQLYYLEQQMPKKQLTYLLEEDYVGDPILCNEKYMTSYNTILQLYHLLKYTENCNLNLNKIHRVVEWGGGYGNFAKIFLKFINHQCTYVLIDTPLFACLQWLYLSTICGEKIVNIIKNTKGEIKKNKINIVPLSFLQSVQIKGDLFVSMWGLSESAKFAQNYVASKGWFGTKHIFLGYQRKSRNLPYAERVGELVKQKGANLHRIPFLPGNYYAIL